MSARRRPGDPPAPTSLEEALPGVRPLRGRDEIVAPARPRPKPRAVSPRTPDPVDFEVRKRGEQLEGIAPGIDRRHLRRLRRGEVAPDRELDLHGMTAAQARQAVRGALAEALAGYDRCVRVIHGRGSHSQQGPRLKAALLEWLAEPPHGPRVLAFASTPDGGATSILLRRSR